jgi:hypothetical protein
MLQHSNDSIEIDNLEQLSRAELRVLWEWEFASKAPPTLGRDILALGLPMRGRNGPMAGSPGQWPRSLIGYLLACFRTKQPMRPRLQQARCPGPAPY